jgi:hypothetical protein
MLETRVEVRVANVAFYRASSSYVLMRRAVASSVS